jgi:hypothetical protein
MKKGMKKKGPAPVFDLDVIRADWRHLADLHAGTPEAIRFLTLLAGVASWDGQCPNPVTRVVTRD